MYSIYKNSENIRKKQQKGVYDYNRNTNKSNF